MANFNTNSTFIIKWVQINVTEQTKNSTTLAGASSAEGLSAFRTMLVVGMVVTISITVIGVIGNLLTIATLIHQFRMPPRKRYVVKMTADTILIMNLCVADLCYCGISLPVMFVIYKNLYKQCEDSSLDNYCPLSEETCEWAAFVRYTNAITEWTTLGMMALERCVTIYRFQRKMCPSRLFTPGRTFSYCIIVCLLGMVVQTLTLTDNFGTFGYNSDTLKCDFMPTQNKSFFVTPRVFFFALESAVPCCCILIGYVIILFQVYSSKNFFGGNTLTSSTQMSMALRRSKTTRLIVMLLTVYLVCVIPICIYNVVIGEEQLGDLGNQIIGIALYCLYWIQYGVNNFIYVVSNEKYRNAYRQLFCFILCKDVEFPTGSHHLKVFSIKPVTPSVAITSEASKVRLRTPSEMMMECQDENKCSSFKRSSKMRVTFVTAGGLDLDSLKEVPILIFPTAKLNRMYSSLKKKTDFKGHMFNCVSKKKHLCFHDFRKCKRRLSLTVFENCQSSERKRSLSV